MALNSNFLVSIKPIIHISQQKVILFLQLRRVNVILKGNNHQAGISNPMASLCEAFLLLQLCMVFFVLTSYEHAALVCKLGSLH